MKSSVAVSTEKDTQTAVKSVVDKCMNDLDDKEKIIAGLVFWGAGYDPEIIAKNLNDLLPGVPSAGCSTDGEISTEGLSVNSICLMLISSEKVSVRVEVVESLSINSEEAGSVLAEKLKSDNARTMILLPDGLTANGSAIIRGALKILGKDFIIGGGTAGDGGKFEKTWQICNGKACTDALVGLMFYSPDPMEIGFGVMSGWSPIGIPKTVTHAEGNIVYKIEEKTALDIYTRFLGERASRLPSIGVEYPFGLVDKSGSVEEEGLHEGEEYLLLRAPMVVERDTGAIHFAAEIPQGAKIKMTRAKTDDIIEASGKAAKKAKNFITGTPDIVFFFSCMARKIVLGRKTQREIETAQDIFGKDTPMIGFYTYGEIANCGSTNPVCRFHNETATFLILKEK